jgi:hypothetical protein
MSDLRDHVVQAFNVLDIDRGIDVDSAAQELLDVEVALRVTAARRIGVGELVDQDDLRTPSQDGIEVHFLEPLPLILDAPARNDLQSLQQRFGLPAAVGFDDAHDDVVAVFLPGAGLLQHLVGLADAGCGAHEDSQLAGTTFLPPGRFEQRLRRWSLVSVAPLF